MSSVNISSVLLSKKEFIIKQIARTNKKNYENYVVTRIIHLLNDLEIKFVTQQYFKRPDGNFGLSDLYFPQFNLSIEIDEGQHKTAIDQDNIRDQDYLLATQNLLQHPLEWMPKRVRVYGDISLSHINKEIDDIIEYIKLNKKKAITNNSFKIWDINKEFNYSDKKIFDINDNIVFKTIVDGINYFRSYDKKYKGYQRAGAFTMDGLTQLWFPKLYPNKDWNNSISNNDTLIKEIPEQTSKLKIINTHLEHIIGSEKRRRRIVFARVKSELGFILYRFKGYFVLDEMMSRELGYCCYKRKATRVSVPDGKPIN